VAGLGREVARLRRQLEAHEQLHERAQIELERQAAERARLRRTTRRYWVTTLATVVGSNVATLALVASHGHA
jgi:hypothetical protein